MKYVISAILCIVMGFAAGWFANGWRLEASYNKEKMELSQAGAESYREIAENTNKESTQYVKKTYELKSEISALKKELSNAKKINPVAGDCRPDSNRLRILKDAVRATNTAAGYQSG